MLSRCHRTQTMARNKIHIHPGHGDVDSIWWQVDRQSNDLEAVEVSSVYISNVLAHAISTLFHRHQIKIMILRMCEVWPDVLYEILQTSQHVEHLTLHRVRHFDSKCMRLLTQRGSKLRSLSIHDKPHFENTLEVLLKRLHHLRQLETLHLDGSLLSDEGDVTTALVHSLQTPGALRNLKVLSLKSCMLSDDAVARILLPLLNPALLPSLTRIDLSMNDCREQGMDALGRFLESPTCHLEQLELICLLPRIQHADFLEPLSRALKLNRSLKSLHLSGNALQDVSLMQSLEVNIGLEELDWNGNSLDEQGLFVLSRALSHNRTLKCLNLKSNAFTSLHHLDLSANFTLRHLTTSCRGPEAQHISFLCEMNAAGRRLVRDNPTHLGLWAIVLERCNDNLDALLYFLKNTPSIWMKKDNC